MRFARAALVLGVCSILFSSLGYAVEPAPQLPNADPTYQKLRTIGLGGEAVALTNVELKRDLSIFTL